MKVMRIMGIAGIETQEGTPEVVGQYVKSFDVEAGGGRGLLVATPEAAEALRFDTLADAGEFWRRVPVCHPIRLDGEPNRPMTAFHVQIEEAP